MLERDATLAGLWTDEQRKIAAQAANMTQEVFCDSLQHYVDLLRALDHGHLKNVMYGFGQAASAQLT
eukprot:13101502-Alexandrium_andersonii.AAC.1